MKWVLLAAILANCAGACSPKKETENPERDLCYDDAADRARERGLTECKGYASTAECPAWPKIEREQKRAQEACP